MEIKADLSGTVFKVLVHEGDIVAAGDEVMILESMKMEIPVEATAPGRVARILVKPGDAIVDGQVLLEVDPA